MTLGEILAERAREAPDRLAFTFTGDGEDVVGMSYAELHRCAQRTVGRLRERVPAGSHVLLLLEPGLEFAAAVFACFQAGIVGVSTHPPNPARVHRTLPRLRAVVTDARVDAVLATTAIRDATRPLFAEDPSLAATPWIVVEEEGEDVDPVLLSCEPSDLAFIQYTSGSTLVPRGVMLSHGNLLANAEMITRSMRLCGESRILCWLPPSHDMGLVSGILLPVFVGCPAALMSPMTMLKRPARWLEGISRFGATMSGGPDFAYGLAVRRTTEEERRSLDLSCWEIAFNGAEPVRASTLESFAEAFAGCGFRARSFYPCYGLAEATLMVSGPRAPRSPTLLEVDQQRLRDDDVAVAVTVGSQSPTARLVGCGEPGIDHEVAIVAPERLCELPSGEIGEIWVSGPSVADGYWQKESLSGEIFHGRMSGKNGSRHFLRTGDLGFMLDGELFIVGRMKDVIILNGRTYHSHDLEAVAESAHTQLRPRCSAAFAIESGDARPAAAIVLEVNPADAETLSKVSEAARRQVIEDLEVQFDRVALVSPGAVPKTTSGKVQRGLCRRLLLDGELTLLADWRRC
jgi:acyl-CoA synthetase (AMP-forming)/AMP-acid ligase II